MNLSNRIESIRSIYPDNIVLSIDKSLEESHGNSTNFLDSKFSVRKTSKLIATYQFRQFSHNKNRIRYIRKIVYRIDSTLHEKPNTLFTYTHFDSNIPMCLKTGTIRGELIRRVKVCSSRTQYEKHKRRYIKRLRRWGYSNKFIRWKVNHPNYNDRHKYIHKKQYNHNNDNKQYNTLFLVKKYNVNLDDRNLLNKLIFKYIKSANLLKDYKIMICNKTGDNLYTIINKSHGDSQDN